MTGLQVDHNNLQVNYNNLQALSNDLLETQHEADAIRQEGFAAALDTIDRQAIVDALEKKYVHAEAEIFSEYLELKKKLVVMNKKHKSEMDGMCELYFTGFKALNDRHQKLENDHQKLYRECQALSERTISTAKQLALKKARGLNLQTPPRFIRYCRWNKTSESLTVGPFPKLFFAQLSYLIRFLIGGLANDNYIKKRLCCYAMSSFT